MGWPANYGTTSPGQNSISLNPQIIIYRYRPKSLKIQPQPNIKEFTPSLYCSMPMCLLPIPFSIYINLKFRMGQVKYKLIKHMKDHVLQWVIIEGIFFNKEQLYIQINVGMYNFSGRTSGHKGKSKLKLWKSYYWMTCTIFKVFRWILDCAIVH